MRIRYRLFFFGIAFTLAAGLMTAQDLRQVHFKGVINDYSPSNVSGGPWEIRGTWSLDVERTGTARFSADLTMETSDYGITGTSQVDPTNPSTRSPHTHHISMTNATRMARNSMLNNEAPRWRDGRRDWIMKGALGSTRQPRGRRRINGTSRCDRGRRNSSRRRRRARRCSRPARTPSNGNPASRRDGHPS